MRMFRISAFVKAPLGKCDNCGALIHFLLMPPKISCVYK